MVRNGRQRRRRRQRHNIARVYHAAADRLPKCSPGLLTDLRVEPGLVNLAARRLGPSRRCGRLDSHSSDMAPAAVPTCAAGAAAGWPGRLPLRGGRRPGHGLRLRDHSTARRKAGNVLPPAVCCSTLPAAAAAARCRCPLSPPTAARHAWP